jgi:hypothetical protein
MNLERKLIELTFPNIDVDTIMEIICATGNPTIATEKLCGIYNEPQFERFKIINRHQSEFIAYNPWTETIEFSYLRPITKSGYFPKKVKSEDITMYTFDTLSCSSYDDDTFYHSIDTGEFEPATGSCKVDNWNRAKCPSYDLAE